MQISEIPLGAGEGKQRCPLDQRNQFLPQGAVMIEQDPFFFVFCYIWQQTKMDRWILTNMDLKSSSKEVKHALCFHESLFFYSCVKDTPAGTCGIVVGGPSFLFDSGLIFQLLQQLPHTQTLGYPSLPQWECAGFSHVSPLLVRQNVGEVKRGIWLPVTTSIEMRLIPGLSCRISIQITCC